MSEPFLICHLVRGEPAFDIAEQMECSECHEECCEECENKGYWWVIPTSGRRAFPWWHCELTDGRLDIFMVDMPAPPAGIPDHYSTRATTKQPSLAEALATHMRNSAPPIKRRV